MNKIFLNIKQESIPEGLNLNDIFHLSLFNDNKYKTPSEVCKSYPSLYRNERAVSTINAKLVNCGLLKRSEGNIHLTDDGRAIFAKPKQKSDLDKLEESGLQTNILKRSYDILLGPVRSNEQISRVQSKLVECAYKHKVIFSKLNDLYSEETYFKNMVKFNVFLGTYLSWMKNEVDSYDRPLPQNFLNFTESSKLFNRFTIHMKDQYGLILFPNELETKKYQKRNSIMKLEGGNRCK